MIPFLVPKNSLLAHLLSDESCSVYEGGKLVPKGVSQLLKTFLAVPA